MILVLGYCNDWYVLTACPLLCPFSNPVSVVALFCTLLVPCARLYDIVLFLSMLMIYFYATHSSLSSLGVNNILYICFFMSVIIITFYIIGVFKMLIEK